MHLKYRAVSHSGNAWWMYAVVSIETFNSVGFTGVSHDMTGLRLESDCVVNGRIMGYVLP
jgi:hypothetical protein